MYLMDKPILYRKVVLESHSEIPGINDQKTHRTHKKNKSGFSHQMNLLFITSPAYLYQSLDSLFGTPCLFFHSPKAIAM